LSDAVVGATFCQRDGWLSTHEVTQGFAKGSNARFLVNTAATGIRRDTGHAGGAWGVSAVETTRGTISTPVVVNAAGPFAGTVGRMVGLDLPLEPVRRQKVFISPKPQIPLNAPLTIDLVEDAYWRPETGGAYIAWVDPDEPVGEPAEELPTDWDFAATVLEKLIRLNPFWEEIAETLKEEDVHPSGSLGMMIAIFRLWCIAVVGSDGEYKPRIRPMHGDAYDSVRDVRRAYQPTRRGWGSGSKLWRPVRTR
jgi:sarcosine oxidase subunit beta